MIVLDIAVVWVIDANGWSIDRVGIGVPVRRVSAGVGFPVFLGFTAC